jgi:hypothetical protein
MEEDMAKSPDVTKMMQDAAQAFQMDGGKLKDAFRSSAAYGEQFTRIALAAAEQSAELSSKWTRETLAKLGDVSKSKEAPADYGKAMGEFAQAQASMMNEQLAAFAEIARKLQSETLEVVMSAAKEVSSEAQAAVKSATDKVAEATRKTGGN